MIPPSQQPADEDDVRSNNPAQADPPAPVIAVDKYDTAVTELLDDITSDKCAHTEFEGRHDLTNILKRHFPNANA